MTRFGQKMKQQRPRIRNARKEPSTERKLKNPPKITIPWGRGSSPYRPGLFVKQFLHEHGEACAADVFYALKRDLEHINTERLKNGDQPIRGGTYNSFAKYFHWFKLLRLVEPTDKREAAQYDFLEERRFYQLTGKGLSEVQAWADPVRTLHPTS
jgi:hypothetical protein